MGRTNYVQKSLTATKGVKVLNSILAALRQTPLAFGVLGLGLISTGFAWNYTSQNVEREAQIQFDNQVDDAKNSLNNRLQIYIDTMQATKGLFASSEDVSRTEWKAFVESLNLQKRYPGITGLGFIRYLPQSEKAGYERQVRQDTNLELSYADFAIKPPGNRSAYFVIDYIEPFGINHPAFGLDMGHEAIRRAAVEQAERTGQPTATGILSLVQDPLKKPGFSILLPIYRKGMPLFTVANKRSALLGFVYAPFRAEDLIQEALASDSKEKFDLEVYSAQRQIYDRDDTVYAADKTLNSLERRIKTLDVAGQTWNLYFAKLPGFNSSAETSLPFLTLMLGILVSLLLFGITWFLALSRSRAIRDSNESKRLAAEISKVLEKEKELSELKSGFVTMASHEFRTPLTTIFSSTELLERYSHKFTETKKLQHLQRIQVAVKHMTHLLNDVLLIGKAEAGKLEFEPTQLNLVQFCRGLVEDIQVSTDNHTIAFCSQGQCPNACMDEKLLRHILVNLLSNAIKYSPQGGTVQFDVICQQEEVIFRIQDEGIGIPAADQVNLFNSFHRASNVGTISGTGLGLAIVKKSVDSHGGKITVTSEVGSGTTFIVAIPLNRSKNQMRADIHAT
jgi:signal transduction histidine kinase